jgi:hypothetical protein
MTGRAAPNGALWSPVAQLVEQAAVNRWVAGSSPARGAKFSKHLAKIETDSKRLKVRHRYEPLACPLAAW